MRVTARTPDEALGPALAKARRELACLEPRLAATRAEVRYAEIDPNRGRFCVPFLTGMHWVAWPEGEVESGSYPGKVETPVQLILLHYILTADGTAMADRWIAFRNLPGGLGYDGAFQQRANLRLARDLGGDRTAFDSASRALRGEPLAFGDASFSFRVLPRVWLAVVLNLANDEFGADANVLFDAAASHYLPTEDLAVLGGLLVGRLIREAHTQ